MGTAPTLSNCQTSGVAPAEPIGVNLSVETLGWPERPKEYSPGVQPRVGSAPSGNLPWVKDHRHDVS